MDYNFLVYVILVVGLIISINRIITYKEDNDFSKSTIKHQEETIITLRKDINLTKCCGNCIYNHNDLDCHFSSYECGENCNKWVIKRKEMKK